MKLSSLVLGMSMLAITCSANTGEATVAAASNFAGALQRIQSEFERDTPHKLQRSFGATGKLYAQIVNSAPFDVFLSADDETPKKLESEKLAVAGTRKSYAIGRLALWSPKQNVVDNRGDVLKQKEFAHLAIANPKTAPYGAAAEKTLRQLGVWERVESRLVYGENISQTFQFVSTGNAELGFVALSQILALDEDKRGSYWEVPAALHEPLRQDAILLNHGADNPAARAFLEYLHSAKAQTILKQLGYAVPN